MTSPAPHTATLRHAATPALPDGIATPAFILDVAALKRNLATAARIKAETGVKILLATKAWAMPAAFPLMRDTLDGTTASGLFEARLGREEFGKEVHVYAPAYTQEEVSALTKVADHIYFNTPSDRAFSAIGLRSRQEGGHSRQPRLLDGHAWRRSLQPVRAGLSLRHAR